MSGIVNKLQAMKCQLWSIEGELVDGEPPKPFWCSTHKVGFDPGKTGWDGVEHCPEYTVTYEQALEEYNTAKEVLRQVTIDRIMQCEHSEVFESAYTPSSWGSATPPYRVCRDCGFAEEGWGCGYSILQGAASPAERDAAGKMRVTQVFLNDEVFDAVSLKGRDNGYNGLRALLEAELW